MSEQIEIEYKNMLTKEEYELLLKFFEVEDQQIKNQVNHYFDTPSFMLKDVHSAFRMREKGNVFEITLKQPAKVGLLETNQIIEKQEANHLLTNNILPEGEVKKKLIELGIPIERIVYFGSLTTNRVEFGYKDGLIVLDHSLYLDTEDFEVEYEVEDPESGEKNFYDLLANLNIPKRKTENKVKRFYRQKYQQ